MTPCQQKVRSKGGLFTILADEMEFSVTVLVRPASLVALYGEKK